MNSTTGNKYSKYGFKNHNHLIKDRNIFSGDCLTHTVNASNKFSQNLRKLFHTHC